MSDRNGTSPLGAVGRGLVAGAIGTAVFTGYQALQAKLANGDAGASGPPQDWGDVSPPGQVGHRVAEGVFEQDIPVEQARAVTNTVHWLFGTGWGAVYGLLEGTFNRPLTNAVALASAVIAFDYTVLPAMHLYKPPWDYAPSTLAKDFGNHLVYGFSVAAAYRAVDAVVSR